MRLDRFQNHLPHHSPRYVANFGLAKCRNGCFNLANVTKLRFNDGFLFGQIGTLANECVWMENAEALNNSRSPNGRSVSMCYGSCQCCDVCSEESERVSLKLNFEIHSETSQNSHNSSFLAFQ